MSQLKDNVERLLREVKLERGIIITEEDDDEVLGWPDPSHTLLQKIVLDEWPKDLDMSSEHFHGTPITYREPGGVRPALHVCIYPTNDTDYNYFLGMHIDYAAGSDFTHPISVIEHAGEVVGHAISGGKTDQKVVAEMLDTRFGKGKD